MTWKVDVLFQGFPGKLGPYALGWGTWALMRDGRHNVLFDAGGTPVRSKAKEMFGAYGLAFGDIDMIVLSHLHVDHVYNLDLFPQAQFVLAAEEWGYSCGIEPGKRDFFVDEKVIGLLRGYRVRLIHQDGEEILPDMHAMFTPGHTPGCLTAVLNQGDGKWLLTGDSAKNRGELRSGEVQMSVDNEASTRSLQRILTTASRVLPGHDGWLAIRDGKVIPDCENEITLDFAQGVTVNGNQTRVAIRLDD